MLWVKRGSTADAALCVQAVGVPCEAAVIWQALVTD